MRMKIRVVLISDFYERIRIKGIRTFLFMKTLLHCKASPCVSCSIKLIPSYYYTGIPCYILLCHKKVALHNVSSFHWESSINI